MSECCGRKEEGLFKEQNREEEIEATSGDAKLKTRKTRWTWWQGTKT
jgi:hypothetical protein